MEASYRIHQLYTTLSHDVVKVTDLLEKLVVADYKKILIVVSHEVVALIHNFMSYMKKMFDIQAFKLWFEK